MKIINPNSEILKIKSNDDQHTIEIQEKDDGFKILIDGQESGGGAVESVNGKTGKVNLLSEDIKIDQETDSTIKNALSSIDGRIDELEDKYFLIHYTYTEDESGNIDTVECEETFEDIVQAVVENKKIPMIQFDWISDDPIMCTWGINDWGVTFTWMETYEGSSDGLWCVSIRTDSDNQSSFAEYYYNTFVIEYSIGEEIFPGTGIKAVDINMSYEDINNNIQRGMFPVLYNNGNFDTFLYKVNNNEICFSKVESTLISEEEIIIFMTEKEIHINNDEAFYFEKEISENTDSTFEIDYTTIPDDEWHGLECNMHPSEIIAALKLNKQPEVYLDGERFFCSYEFYESGDGNVWVDFISACVPDSKTGDGLFQRQIESESYNHSENYESHLYTKEWTQSIHFTISDASGSWRCNYSMDQLEKCKGNIEGDIFSINGYFSGKTICLHPITLEYDKLVFLGNDVTASDAITCFIVTMHRDETIEIREEHIAFIPPK